MAIKTNTASLQSILDTINSLFEAGGGGLDTSDATAVAGDILSGKTAYAKGNKVTGTIQSQAAQTITPGTSNKTIAAGKYLSGTQTIKGDSNLKAANIKSGTSIFGVSGTYTSDATATAAQILKNQTAYVKGSKVTGTMANNGAISKTFDGIATKSATIPAGYTSGGTVSLDNTIDNAVNTQSDIITQIKSALNGKAAGNGSGGTDTSDATATANDILSGKTAYAKGSKITGNIVTKTSSNLTANGATVTVPAGYYASQATKSVATATQATPSVSINSSGLITASTTQTAGYVSAGTKSGTKQLTTQAAQTITPGTSNKTIASGRYLTGTQTIKGDSNLVAGNIKSGVSIFGVTGNYAGSSSGSGSGGSGYEFGTFTVNGREYDGDDSVYSLPFIIGMTWQEWIDSPMNMYLPVGIAGMCKMYIIGNDIRHMNGAGMEMYLSTTTSSSGAVRPTDVIINGSVYNGYIDEADNPYA